MHVRVPEIKKAPSRQHKSGFCRLPTNLSRWLCCIFYAYLFKFMAFLTQTPAHTQTFVAVNRLMAVLKASGEHVHSLLRVMYGPREGEALIFLAALFRASANQ